MTFIDSGYLIALLNPRDEFHSRALAWSASIAERLIVTEYVIVETVNFFSKPINRPKAHAMVTRLRDEAKFEIVPASSELFGAGLLLHGNRADKEWSLTDCISFVAMKRRSLVRALAYDQHFEQAGFEALLREDPPT
jgi:predicted nucleic acid-binding protein